MVPPLLSSTPSGQGIFVSQGRWFALALGLALEFSVVGCTLTHPGLPPFARAGSGNAERKKEKNGNASTAGRAARPPPVTVSVPMAPGSEELGGGSGALKRSDVKTSHTKPWYFFMLAFCKLKQNSSKCTGT